MLLREKGDYPVQMIVRLFAKKEAAEATSKLVANLFCYPPRFRRERREWEDTSSHFPFLNRRYAERHGCELILLPDA